VSPAPKLGLGIGWREPLARFALELEDLGFVEVVAENLDPRRALPAGLEELRHRGVPVVPHGIRLSLGSAATPDRQRVRHLAAVAERLGSPLVSEHVAYVRSEGMEAGHLLPVERTRVALDALVRNVARVQQALPVPLALEHIASLVEWPSAEMDEATFIAELLDRTGALLLLDVANLYANAHNHGHDPLALIDALPLERLAYVHVGGGVVREGRYHDTHAHAVVPEVLTLLEELARRCSPPGVLLERDDDFPAASELAAELAAIRTALSRGAEQRVAVG
jgi:uncharacterized protein